MSKINNASKSFCHNLTYAHCKTNYWGKNLEECNEIPSQTYFEKQYGQIFPLFVYFFTNNTMCMQLTCAITSDVVHIKLIVIISIKGYANRSEHIKFH